MNFIRTSYKNFNNSSYLLYLLLTLSMTIFYCLLFIDYANFSIFIGTPRLAAGFRNPNQLGYFAVVLFSFTYILWLLIDKKYRILLLLLYFFSIFLSFISLSKASMIGIIAPSFFYLTYIFLKEFFYKQKIKLHSLFFIFSILLFFILPANIRNNLNFYNRLVSIVDEKDSSLSARGYYIFFDGNIFELIFGRGYWGSLYFHQIEIHSTFAALIINYGVIGFCLYAFFIFYWFLFIFSKNGLAGILFICTPSILYGITHNGSRFTFFYFLVAISISFLSKKNKMK